MHPTAGVTAEAICHTAVDALQAKYSAVCLAKYPVVLACGEDGAVHEKIPACDLNKAEADAFNSYPSLLQTMAEYYGIHKPKRQTPLVNAGYGVRIACVLDSVGRFATFHARCNHAADDGGDDDAIQIVVLGAGLDVIGIWFGDLTSTLSSSTKVHLIDVDFADMCHAKKEAFRTLCLIGDSPFCSKQRSPNIVWEGCRQNSERVTYTLVGGDLRDPSFTEDLFSTVMHPNLPTLVLSELVLAYLPTVACDDLLQRCAAALASRGTNCCMLLFEPLGPSPSSTGSVLEAYKRSYFDQFSSKLVRGQAKPKARAENDEPFFPLGSSTRSVEQRMEMAGFRRARASTAGLVASSIPGLDWKPRELFDEHAALVLHFSSYTVAMGFNDGSGSVFRRHVCGWGQSSGMLGRPQPIRLKKDTDSWAWLTEIVRQDEKQVRQLFEQTYKRLFGMHPAIRKMVKTALRKDLSVGGDTRQDDADPETSSIGEHYRRLNGAFLVCVRVGYQPFADVDRSTIKRHLLGGIGIRKFSGHEMIAREMCVGDVVYEIHRLFVDDQARGCGVGTALLNFVIDRIQEAECQGKGSGKILLTATTPAVLDDANRFYQSRGFEVHAEISSGEMRMRTYVKVLGRNKQR